MYFDEAWVLESLRTHVQPQIILDPDNFPDCLLVSYDHDEVFKYKFQQYR